MSTPVSSIDHHSTCMNDNQNKANNNNINSSTNLFISFQNRSVTGKSKINKSLHNIVCENITNNQLLRKTQKVNSPISIVDFEVYDNQTLIYSAEDQKSCIQIVNTNICNVTKAIGITSSICYSNIVAYANDLLVLSTPQTNSDEELVTQNFVFVDLKTRKIKKLCDEFWTNRIPFTRVGNVVFHTESKDGRKYHTLMTNVETAAQTRCVDSFDSPCKIYASQEYLVQIPQYDNWANLNWDTDKQPGLPVLYVINNQEHSNLDLNVLIDSYLKNSPSKKAITAGYIKENFLFIGIIESTISSSEPQKFIQKSYCVAVDLNKNQIISHYLTGNKKIVEILPTEDFIIFVLSDRTIKTINLKENIRSGEAISLGKVSDIDELFLDNIEYTTDPFEERSQADIEHCVKLIVDNNILATLCSQEEYTDENHIPVEQQIQIIFWDLVTAKFLGKHYLPNPQNSLRKKRVIFQYGQLTVLSSNQKTLSIESFDFRGNVSDEIVNEKITALSLSKLKNHKKNKHDQPSFIFHSGFPNLNLITSNNNSSPAQDNTHSKDNDAMDLKRRKISKNDES